MNRQIRQLLSSLSSISDVEKECRQSFARARAVNKYKGKGVFKVIMGDKYKTEG